MMFVLAVVGVMLFVLLMVLALGLGRAAARADEEMDADVVSEEPDWWDDPEWEWPTVAELSPLERHIYEKLVRR